MEYKYLFGSKMLKMSNARDEDWLIFKNKGVSFGKENYKSIPFYKTILSHFMQGKNIKSDAFKALYLYQLSSSFIDDTDYPFADFNILEHKAVWIGYLKAYMNDEKAENRAISQSILPKEFYHILYQYHMIVENAHWISDEAKVDVQKIHDLEMPSSYFYTLKGMTNSLES